MLNEKELSAQLTALRAELEAERTKREEAERKLTAAASNRKNRLTRPFVAGLILKLRPDLTAEEFIEVTDKYFADNGGKTNRNEAAAVARLARKVLDGFNADPTAYPEIPGTAPAKENPSTEPETEPAKENPSTEPETAPAKEAPAKK